MDSGTEPYTTNSPVNAAAVVAMVAITGVDDGLSSGLKAVRAIAVFGLLASFLGRHDPVGGWLATLVLLTGLLAGMLWLMWRRWVQERVVRSLLDRFGVVRFKAAMPIIDEANRFIDEA